MGRAPCCDKATVKKGPWSPEEDARLKAYIEQHGTRGNWIALPQKIGLKRCGKSCRLRWLNYLRPNIKHGGFTEEEDNIIFSLYITIGSRWSIIASQLPGRTDNDVKNYWNTKLKKKLYGKNRKQPAAGRANRYLNQEVGKEMENFIVSDGAVMNPAQYMQGIYLPAPHDNQQANTTIIPPSFHLSVDGFPVQDQTYMNSRSMVSSATLANPVFGNLSHHVPELFFPRELAEGFFHGSPDQLVLESFYGVDGTNGSFGTSSTNSAESSRRGTHMNPMFFSPINSENEASTEDFSHVPVSEAEIRYSGSE